MATCNESIRGRFLKPGSYLFQGKHYQPFRFHAGAYLCHMSKLTREIRHLRELMDEREKQRIQHDELTQRAVDEKVVTLDARLDGMNEFRAQQKDMINTLVTRVEFDMLEKRVTELENFQGKIMAIVGLSIFLMPVIFWWGNRQGKKVV